MSAGTVGVPVVKFLCARFAHFSDGHRKVEIYTSQWVVPVDRDDFVGDVNDGYYKRARIGFDSELHAQRKILDVGELLTRNFLLQSLIPLSVSILWSNGHLQFIANHFTGQRPF